MAAAVVFGSDHTLLHTWVQWAAYIRSILPMGCSALDTERIETPRK